MRIQSGGALGPGTASLPAWIFVPLIVGAIGLLLADELHKLVGGRLKAGQPVPTK
ncbi:MAG: hypothetical protein MRJ92_01910 [Nitrospira sp.]|nr:hypothetical protein [Nitrospira sp.]